MSLPPSTVLLIVLIAALANVVVLIAAYARHRAARSSRFVEVGGFMSSSYAGGGEDDPDAVPGGWLPPASEGWPASRHVVSDSNGYAPTATPPPASTESDVEPFAYPEPTTLEQRGAIQDGDDADETFEGETEDDLDDTEMDEGDDAEMEAMPMTTAETGEPEPEPQPAMAPPDLVISSPRGRDPLTGMLDAAAFEEVMAHEDAREQRYSRPATVIVF